MALEPRTVTAAEEENPELRDMTRRFWIGVVLTAPLLAVAMGSMFCRHEFMRSLRRASRLDRTRPGHARGALGRLAVLPARLGVARQPQPQHVHLIAHRHRRGLRLQRGRDARSAASFPTSFRGQAAGAASISRPPPSITTLVLLGQVLELRARSRTGGAIRALLDLAPEDRAAGARRRQRTRTCRSSEVQPGDRLRVRPGEKVPVDGVVLEGPQLASTSR